MAPSLETRGAAPKQMPVSDLRHPFGPREVTVEGTARLIGLAVWVNVQDDPRDIAPVGVFRIGIEQTQVRDDMLLVVGSDRWIGWGQISDVRIERRLLHGRSCDESTTRSTQPRPRLRVKPDTDYQRVVLAGSNMTTG
jgi:hypothetical protein